jgi:hypothetical protein
MFIFLKRGEIDSKKSVKGLAPLAQTMVVAVHYLAYPSVQTQSCYSAPFLTFLAESSVLR